MDAYGDTSRGLKIATNIEISDFMIRLRPEQSLAEIGQLIPPNNEGGKVLTIKKLRLANLRGYILPVFDAEAGKIVFFTISEAIAKPIVVEAAKDE